MTTPLEIRLRQERLYTILTAQEVADGKRQVSAIEKRDLDRYARWHFRLPGFDYMVQECLEMSPGYGA